MAEPKPHLVALDRDHPGFRDPVYRARRNAIAQQALDSVDGAPAPVVAYTDEERGVWRHVLGALAPLHQRFATPTFLGEWPTLGFSTERVPQFDEVNRVLETRTGFRLAPVAGLVSPAEFMLALADGVFLATQYMRHHSMPLYTPEPDVIHELVGHAALLADERYARVNRRFGRATRRARPAQIDALIRVYWYSLEFGVARHGDGLQVLGAGLLSSFGELGRFEQATLRPFDLDEMANTPFDPTQYQRTLFVGRSEAAMLDAVEAWLAILEAQ